MSMYPIATATPNNTSAVTFTNIPQTFSHLVVHASVFTNTAQGMLWAVNGDSNNANYRGQAMWGNGSTIGSASANNRYVLSYAGFHDSTNPYGFVMTILDYTNTNKNKSARILTGGDRNGAGGVEFLYQVWLNTSAITSITFTPDANNFVTPAKFTLYGMTTSTMTGA